jgi:hypothetical protein
VDFLGTLWRRATSPAEAFRLRATEAPSLDASLRLLLLLRSPLAFLSSVLGYWHFHRFWTELAHPGNGVDWVRRLRLPVSPEDWRALCEGLPVLPPTPKVLPWLALAAPVGVLGIWLHDAVWDHGCLWLLGGLKQGRGVRGTLVAESEALAVGSLGAAAALLGAVPYLGTLLALPLFALGVWFWVLRGFALAAWHDCPVWKGVTATVLHGILAGCCLVAMAGLMLAVLAAALA